MSLRALASRSAPAELASPDGRCGAAGPGCSWIVIVVAAATVATGLAVHHATGRLGTAAPPFVGGWAPRAALLPALVGAAVLAAAVALLPRLVTAPLKPWHVDLALLTTALGAGLAVGAARQGTHGWWVVFDLGPRGSFEAPNEYLTGLPTLSYGVRFYLDRFAEMVTSQPVNVAGHPPGPLLLVHVLRIDSAQGLAALCIAASAACAPLAHRLGRALHGDRAGRIAGVLCALCPDVLLFGVTSYDAVFAASGALAALLLVRPGRASRVLGAVALAAAAFLSWALLGVGAWEAAVVWRREGAAAALRLAATCGLVLVAIHVVLAAGWGYDPIGTLRATDHVYRSGISSRRPYWFWVFGSPVAWGAMLGPPIALLVVRAARAAGAAGLATALVVAVAAGAGFTKAESERIWLFLAPLACVAAAPLLSPARLRAVLVLLALQALGVQLLLGTVW